MSLTSLHYVLFLIICVFLYWLLPQKWRRGMLLLASVGFYLFTMPEQLPVMFTYLWLIYGLGLGIARSIKKKKKAKHLLILGICLSICYLFFYKYLNFTLSIFTGRSASLSLIVPMGISYITFQCISYLVMICRGEMRALSNPALLFLYALFFPKVTAGPIESPDSFLKEVRKRHSLSWKNVLSSSALILVGFTRKLAAADLIAPAVNTVFGKPEQADGLSTLIVIILYSAQIYFDFSGYTDIACGSARLFGIHLTENFNHPYSASSIVDFWRRWHISLTDWLRKYIYFPLGGSRVSTSRRYFNIIVTFLVSGLWHGASLTFVVWGFLHGLFQVTEVYFRKNFTDKKHKTKLMQIFNQVRTLALVALCWVFFRADTLENAFRVLGGLFARWTSPAQSFSVLGLSVGAWIIFLITSLTTGQVKKYILSKHLTPKAGVLCCAALTVLTLIAVVLGSGSGAKNSFIYFSF